MSDPVKEISPYMREKMESMHSLMRSVKPGESLLVIVGRKKEFTHAWGGDAQDLSNAILRLAAVDSTFRLVLLAASDTLRAEINNFANKNNLTPDDKN